MERLRANFPIQPSSRVLVLGCETGFLCESLIIASTMGKVKLAKLTRANVQA